MGIAWNRRELKFARMGVPPCKLSLALIMTFLLSLHLGLRGCLLGRRGENCGIASFFVAQKGGDREFM